MSPKIEELLYIVCRGLYSTYVTHSDNKYNIYVHAACLTKDDKNASSLFEVKVIALNWFSGVVHYRLFSFCVYSGKETNKM